MARFAWTAIALVALACVGCRQDEALVREGGGVARVGQVNASISAGTVAVCQDATGRRWLGRADGVCYGEDGPARLAPTLNYEPRCPLGGPTMCRHLPDGTTVEESVVTLPPWGRSVAEPVDEPPCLMIRIGQVCFHR